MSDHASVAAATTAGFTKQQTDRGASAGSPRYFTVLEYANQKGFPGQEHAYMRAVGTSDVSAAAADTAALNALNGQRRIRYAAGATATDRNGIAVAFDTD